MPILKSHSKLLSVVAQLPTCAHVVANPGVYNKAPCSAECDARQRQGWLIQLSSHLQPFLFLIPWDFIFFSLKKTLLLKLFLFLFYLENLVLTCQLSRIKTIVEI